MNAGFFSWDRTRDGTMMDSSLLQRCSKRFVRMQRRVVCSYVCPDERFSSARYQKRTEKLRSPQDLGPPPQELALQSNRMSPLGIAMLYASDNAETALRETVSDSGTYVVGEFRTRRDAIILDLTQLLPVPSIFELATDQAAYTARRSRSFLHYIA